MSQHISISIFSIKKGYLWWGFKQMGRQLRWKEIEGIQFLKLMGTGSKAGFSIIPDFSTYILLTVFDQEKNYINFCSDKLFSTIHNRAKEQLTLTLESIRSHGQWSGYAPFDSSESIVAENEAIAVITRASIKPMKWWRFWWRVPHIANDLNSDCLLAKGMGEIPFLEQATFSIWKSESCMLDWAYRQRHKHVVSDTQKYDWYAEELFARFRIKNTEGSYKGFDQSRLFQNTLK